MFFSIFNNKLRLTAVCLLANFILAGFLVQVGLLTEPIATVFDIEITFVAKQFSFLYGGYLAGSLIAFFILDYISIRLALFAYSLITIISTVVLYYLRLFTLLPVLLTIIGTMGGISACIAGTIISNIWQEKYRETLFLAQDASFNLGGTLYPILTAVILTSGLPWTISYLIVAASLIVVIVLVLTSKVEFDLKQLKKENDNIAVEWNSGIIIAGIALFLTITGKYMIIVWLPNYAETILGATKEEAGQLISSIFGAALLGSVAGTIIISKLRLSYFIMAAITFGFISSIQFTFAESVGDLILLSSFFGLAISVLYNVFIAYGVSFVKNPSHKHIAYILFCGGLASTLAPYLSSILVEIFNARIALMSGAVLYAFVFIIVAAFDFLQKSKQ